MECLCGGKEVRLEPLAMSIPKQDAASISKDQRGVLVKPRYLV
jgi:hypothetical protein